MRSVGSEDGGVAVIVAISLVVLLSMGALVLDVGNLYWERRQLQNAADAGALAAAQDFATWDDGHALKSARDYALENNVRGAHVDPITGFLPEIQQRRVTVTAETGDFAQPGVLTSWLGGFLGVDEYATSATATASWDPIMVFPLALCDAHHSQHVTGHGLGPTAATPVYHGNDNCPFGYDGDDTFAGGFGWLRMPGAEVRVDKGICDVQMTADQWLPARPGNAAPTGQEQFVKCFAAINRQIDRYGDASVVIPVFEAYDEGAKKLHITKLARFRLTGYDVAGGGSTHHYPQKNACTSPDKDKGQCLVGYFYDELEYDHTLQGSLDIQLIG